MTREQRLSRLNQILTERILILDGAMGTMIQSYKLEEEDYRGERFADWASDLKGNNDLLVLTQPQIIGDIHTAYLDAGADIIETNSFNANHYGMADYGMEELVYELNVAAPELPVKPVMPGRLTRNHALSPGCWARCRSPRPCHKDVNNPGARDVSFDQLREAYTVSIQGLIEGGADIILVETVFDTLNAKAALFAH